MHEFRCFLLSSLSQTLWGVIFYIENSCLALGNPRYQCEKRNKIAYAHLDVTCMQKVMCKFVFYHVAQQELCIKESVTWMKNQNNRLIYDQKRGHNNKINRGQAIYPLKTIQISYSNFPQKYMLWRKLKFKNLKFHGHQVWGEIRTFLGF